MHKIVDSYLREASTPAVEMNSEVITQLTIEKYCETFFERVGQDEHLTWEPDLVGGSWGD